MVRRPRAAGVGVVELDLHRNDARVVEGEDLPEVPLDRFDLLGLGLPPREVQAQVFEENEALLVEALPDVEPW